MNYRQRQSATNIGGPSGGVRRESVRAKKTGKKGQRHKAGKMKKKIQGVPPYRSATEIGGRTISGHTAGLR